MQKSELIEYLRVRVPLMSGLGSATLERLARESCEATFAPGASIAHQGDEGLHLGVVLTGRVSASVVDDDGHCHVLGQLEAGSTFNELALMTGDAEIGRAHV